MKILEQKTYLLEFVEEGITTPGGDTTFYRTTEDESVGRLHKYVVLHLTKKEHNLLMLILETNLRDFMVTVAGNDTQTTIEGPLSHVDRLISKLHEYLD